MTNLMTSVQDARLAVREKFIADNHLVLDHIVGNDGERIEQWDWPKKASGGKYDHYLLITVWYDESWSVSLMIDASQDVDMVADTTRVLKAIVAVMDGKAFIAK